MGHSAFGEACLSEGAAPHEARPPPTHIDVLLPAVLGTDLGVLDEVQVSAPDGDGCVSTAKKKGGV